MLLGLQGTERVPQTPQEQDWAQMEGGFCCSIALRS